MEVNKVYCGDCLDVLKTLPENSVDSICCDPPYELGFMGKSWDNTGIANNKDMWAECLRVLKPGGHLLSFSGTRTYHRMACAIEDAGFEVRDMIEWCYGSGFPKSLNIGKAVDKLQGNERVITGSEQKAKPTFHSQNVGGKITEIDNIQITKGTSEWEGWGTALKPAHEPICMARKPLDRWWKIKDDGKKVMGRVMTVAENCLKWGTGGINIDESRVGTEEMKARPSGKSSRAYQSEETTTAGGMGEDKIGRFPANLITDGSEEVRECFPEQKSGAKKANQEMYNHDDKEFVATLGASVNEYQASSGNASRFFKSILYYPKASKSERNKNTNNYLIIEICVDNTEVAQLQPKVILEKTELWFTELFGKEKMEEYQMDFKSTIKTETKKTTILIILNYSQHLNIKEYIVGAIKTKTESGGSPVASVVNISEWRAIIIKELTEYLLGVNPVVSPTQLRISVNANNFHSTVKPLALCEYLIKMITPKGGIVLDPFAGSGSTLVAAKQNGFQYIGIELTEEYIPIIEARLNSPTQDKLL